MNVADFFYQAGFWQWAGALTMACIISEGVKGIVKVSFKKSYSNVRKEAYRMISDHIPDSTKMICPHCGADESWRVPEKYSRRTGGKWRIECGSCGEEYMLKIKITVTYSSEKE